MCAFSVILFENREERLWVQERSFEEEQSWDTDVFWDAGEGWDSEDRVGWMEKQGKWLRKENRPHFCAR